MVEINTEFPLLGWIQLHLVSFYLNSDWRSERYLGRKMDSLPVLVTVPWKMSEVQTVLVTEAGHPVLVTEAGNQTLKTQILALKVFWRMEVVDRTLWRTEA